MKAGARRRKTAQERAKASSERPIGCSPCGAKKDCSEPFAEHQRLRVLCSPQSDKQTWQKQKKPKLLQWLVKYAFRPIWRAEALPTRRAI